MANFRIPLAPTAGPVKFQIIDQAGQHYSGTGSTMLDPTAGGSTDTVLRAGLVSATQQVSGSGTNLNIWEATFPPGLPAGEYLIRALIGSTPALDDPDAYHYYYNYSGSTEVTLASINVGAGSGSDVLALLKADRYVVKDAAGWQKVLTEEGTGAPGVGTELLRKNLNDVAGSAVRNESTVVGQEVVP